MEWNGPAISAARNRNVTLADGISVSALSIFEQSDGKRAAFGSWAINLGGISEVTARVDATILDGEADQVLLQLDDGTASNRLTIIRRLASQDLYAELVVDSALEASFALGAADDEADVTVLVTIGTDAFLRCTAISVRLGNDIAGSQSAIRVPLPVFTKARIGADQTGSQLWLGSTAQVIVSSQYVGRLDSARLLAGWQPPLLDETISLLEFVDEEDVDGSTDNSYGFSAAIDAALSEGKRLLVPTLSAPYVIGTTITKTINAGEKLQIYGDGDAEIIFTTDAFVFNASTVGSVSPTGDWSPRDRLLSVADASGVVPGDVLHRRSPLSQEGLWHYLADDCHVISAIDGNDIQISGRGLELAHQESANQVWVATEGENVLWYPSAGIDSEDIVVLVNAVENESASFEAKNGDSATYGWLITIEAEADDEIIVKKNTATTATVYRGGALLLAGITFSGDDGGSPVTMTGLRCPIFKDVNYRSNEQLGFAFHFLACVSPIIVNSTVLGGLYVWMFQLGTRGSRVYNLDANGTHHAVSSSTFASDTETQNVAGIACSAVLDAHPSFDVVFRNLTENTGVDGLNVRGEGGALIDATINVGSGFFHGIAWHDNGAVNSPRETNPRDRNFSVVNVSSSVNDYEINLKGFVTYYFDNTNIFSIEGQLGYLEPASLGLVVENSRIGRVKLLSVENAVVLTDSAFSIVDFGNSYAPGEYASVTIDGCTIEGAAPLMPGFASDGAKTRSLTVTDTIFRYIPGEGEPGADDGKLGTDWNAPSYLDVTFDGCTFDGVTFADAASSRSESIVYGGTTPNTYLNGAVDQDE